MRLAIGILMMSGIVLISPSDAHSGPNDAEWNPPARYDHTYSGKLTVRRLPQRQLLAACNDLFIRNHLKIRASGDMRGCSVGDEINCEIITIDRTYMKATPKAVLRHETGHCNGWPTNHPD